MVISNGCFILYSPANARKAGKYYHIPAGGVFILPCARTSCNSERPGGASALSVEDSPLNNRLSTDWPLLSEAVNLTAARRLYIK
ncbi:MAG: hypothetical protein [Olavius algarvensis Gamma 3 endosymbiont]|nr:MAG: hypothetical protein [Olavius algarvensis Gamma 3 endosymbiont]